MIIPSQVASQAQTRHLLKNPVAMESALGATIAALVTAGVGVWKGKQIHDAKNAATAVATQAGKQMAQTIISDSSLAELTQVSNIEPIVLLDDNLRTLPKLDKFFMTMTNIYLAYYLQASALSNKVNGVSIISRLDRLNPNRNLKAAALDMLQNSALESLVDFGYKYPSYAKPLSVEDAGIISSKVPELPYALEGTEVVVYNPVNAAINNTKDAFGVGKEDTNKGNLKHELGEITKLDNLAVGKLANVTIAEEGQQITIPVAVRVRPMSVPSIVLTQLLALGDVKESWSYRWHRWKAGELRFMQDLILQQDRLAKQRKLLWADKSGFLKNTLERVRKNQKAALMSGNPSLGTVSSFVMVSKETMKAAEYQAGSSFDNLEFRNRIFAENAAMVIIVVDVEWERLTVYTKGVSLPAEYSFSQFEGMSKDGGVNYLDIMKAYTMGNNPRF